MITKRSHYFWKSRVDYIHLKKSYNSILSFESPQRQLYDFFFSYSLCKEKTNRSNWRFLKKVLSNRSFLFELYKKKFSMKKNYGTRIYKPNFPTKIRRKSCINFSLTYSSCQKISFKILFHNGLFVLAKTFFF